MSSIGSITAGPDGALWLLTGAGFERIDPASGVVAPMAPQFKISDAQGEITTGPDGALWFTDGISASVGRLSTAGQVMEYPLPKIAGYPVSITQGTDGALWFISYGETSNFIGRITVAGNITEYPLPTSHGRGQGNYQSARSIVEGSDGALWFVEQERAPFGGRIGRMTMDGQVTEFELPPPPSQLLPGMVDSGPYRMIAGQDKALWFTEVNANQIGRITTTGVVTEFKVSSDTYVGPKSLVAEPDGTLWFTVSRFGPDEVPGDNQLGRLTPDGKVALFPIPTPAGVPWQLAISPDGDLWVTHSSGILQAHVRS